MWTMFAVLVLITVGSPLRVSKYILTLQIRIIFRLVEFTKGFEPGNPMLFNEAYVYCLDATPIFLALLLLSAIHPGRVLVGADSEFPQLSRNEKKMLKQEKKALNHERKEQKRRSKKKGYADVEAGLS
jgi:hypothetical protein